MWNNVYFQNIKQKFLNMNRSMLFTAVKAEDVSYLKSYEWSLHGRKQRPLQQKETHCRIWGFVVVVSVFRTTLWRFMFNRCAIVCVCVSSRLNRYLRSTVNSNYSMKLESPPPLRETPMDGTSWLGKLEWVSMERQSLFFGPSPYMPWITHMLFVDLNYNCSRKENKKNSQEVW